jgi:hypothetical protein
MLMSVKNSSRDELVSRNSNQMASGEYASENACEEIAFYFYKALYLNVTDGVSFCKLGHGFRKL